MTKLEFLQKIQQKEAEELQEYEKLENELVDKYRSYIKNNEKSNAVILVLIENTRKTSKTAFLVRMIKNIYYFSYIKTTIKEIIFCFKHKELINKVLNHDKRKKYD